MPKIATHAAMRQLLSDAIALRAAIDALRHGVLVAAAGVDPASRQAIGAVLESPAILPTPEILGRLAYWEQFYAMRGEELERKNRNLIRHRARKALGVARTTRAAKGADDATDAIGEPRNPAARPSITMAETVAPHDGAFDDLDL